MKAANLFGLVSATGVVVREVGLVGMEEVGAEVGTEEATEEATEEVEEIDRILRWCFPFTQVLSPCALKLT
jgi:hypothetical protein